MILVLTSFTTACQRKNPHLKGGDFFSDLVAEGIEWAHKECTGRIPTAPDREVFRAAIPIFFYKINIYFHYC